MSEHNSPRYLMSKMGTNMGIKMLWVFSGKVTLDLELLVCFDLETYQKEYHKM